MSLDAAIFRTLVEHGATPEMLLAVVEAAAQVDEERKERKRANNAARQQRFRDKNKADSNAHNALQSVTTRDERDLPPNEYISNPPTNSPVAPSGATPPHQPLPPVQDAFEDFRSAAQRCGWANPTKLSHDRRKKLAARLREHGREGWLEALSRAERSDMLGHDPPTWFDFDFLVKNPDNILKLLEGKYDERFGQSGFNGHHEGPGRTVVAANRVLERLGGGGRPGF